MVCYAVPLVATVITYIVRKTGHHRDVHSFWLNLMFLGGALFGGIDHLWNGELFLLGPGLMMDMALGFTITGGTLAAWGLIVYKEQLTTSWMNLGNRLHILK